MASCAAADKAEEPCQGQGLIESAKYLAVSLLEAQHYTKIHQALASHWDRLHSLSAAMKLMETYGVVLKPEEEQRLAGMDEAQQINALVMKMPQQSNEQFQQFFLQLQLLVSTATCVRRALEEGRPDQVEDALNDADSTGISQYILRMAIVQAGSEVASLRAQNWQWMKEADARCGKLIRGQEDAMQAQKKLAAANAQLAFYRTEQNDRAKKVVMNFVTQSKQGLTSSTFKAWSQHVKQIKFEDDVASDLKQRLREAEDQLFRFREKRMGGVRGVMSKKAMLHDMQLAQEIFRTWHNELKEAREKLGQAGQIRDFQDKLKAMQDLQLQNAKQFMVRMTAESEYGLMGMVFQAFVSHHEDYQKEKEMEDSLKKQEKLLEQFMQSQSEGAKKVLEKMGGATSSGLVKQVFLAWREEVEESKKEMEIEAFINANNSKMALFSSKHKDSGAHVMDRAKYHLEQGVLLRILGAWRLDTKMEMSLRVYHQKIDAKRAQLVGVQHMFRRFAQELEGSFNKADTGRDLRDGPPPGRRMTKHEGTVSLPDINQKHSGRPQQQPPSQAKPTTPSKAARTPGGSNYPSSRSPADAPHPRSAWH